ncbi:heme-dependent oxidative N-demethylase subunit alpha family protein, partial [Sphingomonas sp.]|uniref:heme-dependent oxidative N-demethylase subunit alpha family protein n=1 Tax=Sphingomonas sp. TaxID=28214 RepID=UPI002ED82E03
MSLGFSVETLVPAGRSGGALRMGLSRVAEADWLFPAPDLGARVAAFATHPDSVVVLPQAAHAAQEIAALIGVAGGLGEAAKAVWEDLCILQPIGADGVYVLTAGALAFPTDWHLGEKIGLPVTAIHAPIHGYAEQLAQGVDHVLA